MRTEVGMLHAEYVAAWLAGDAGRLARSISADFVCRDWDGLILTREAFLRHAARGPGVSAYRVDDIVVRVTGSVAEVEYLGSFERPGGGREVHRAILVCRRAAGEWRVVSALSLRPGSQRRREALRAARSSRAPAATR